MKKKAFSCFCSENWLNNKKKEAKEKQVLYLYDNACANLPAELVIDNTSPFTVRLKKPTENIIINDLIKGDLEYKSTTLDSFVILHQDKTPTTNFASAVDDMLNDISLIIRDENLIGNTPKQDHIRASLKYDKKIQYAHIPTILNTKDNTSNIKWLLEEGFLPEAIINYLLLLGTQMPQEIFTFQEAVKWLDLSKISHSPTSFDLEKLKYINSKHLKMMEDKELSRYVGFADEQIGKVAKIYLQEEVSTTKELRLKIEPIFSTKTIPDSISSEAALMKKIILEAPYFDKYDDFQKFVMNETNLDNETFSKIFRLLLTGNEKGPDLEELYDGLKNYIGEIIK